MKERGPSAGSDMNRRTYSVLYGNGESDWQRRDSYTPYIKSAPCDVRQGNFRRETQKRAELKIDSSLC